MPSSLPRYKSDLNASYLIEGGLGGLGRSVARWMAVRAEVAVFDIISSSISVEALGRLAAGKSEVFRWVWGKARGNIELEMFVLFFLYV